MNIEIPTLSLSQSAEEDEVVAGADCNDINEQNRDINPSWKHSHSDGWSMITWSTGLFKQILYKPKEEDRINQSRHALAYI